MGRIYQVAKKSINLDQEITLGRKSQGKMPTKTSINLVVKKESALKTRKGITWTIIGALAVVLLAGLLIVRPIIGLISARAEVEDLTSELEQINKEIGDNADIEKEYAHYTIEDMTPDELARVDRVSVMRLVDTVNKSGGSVTGFELSENVMVIKEQGSTLAELNNIAQTLEQQDIVERCVINSADKGKQDTAGVEASFIIYLTNGETEGEEGNADA